MTANEMRSLVDDEVGREFNEEDQRSNPHGVQLARSLLAPPQLRTYLDNFNNNRPIDMWLVLEEDPDGHSGYEIVFDEPCGMFGLAVAMSGPAVFIGFHGSFLETLAAM